MNIQDLIIINIITLFTVVYIININFNIYISLVKFNKRLVEDIILNLLIVLFLFWSILLLLCKFICSYIY